jgi:hypothetical protein
VRLWGHPADHWSKMERSFFRVGSLVVETGIEPLDDLLQGGLPVGAVSELRNVYRRMLQHHWSLSFFQAIGCAGFGPPVDDDVHLGNLTVLNFDKVIAGESIGDA